jgi:phage terminase large subunit-like protein
MSDAQLEAELRVLLDLDTADRTRWRCDRPGCDGTPHAGWLHNHARAQQWPPAGPWGTWLIMTGRGFGKTRTGSETCREWGQAAPMHIAVGGENFTKVRDLCFEHPTSGLRAVIPADLQRAYTRAVGNTVLELRNGTVFRALSIEKPDQPRGYAFDKAWIDEYAAARPEQATDFLNNVRFALREAVSPQIILTTTPRPREHIRHLVQQWRTERELAAAEGRPPDVTRIRVTTGTMLDNIANLSDDAVAELVDLYEGTRLGRQELGGELLEDHPGALWESWMFDVEGFRLEPVLVPDLARKVLAIDPAASVGEGSDLTAFVVAGRDHGRNFRFPDDDRPRGYVLHAEEMNALPEKRMQRASELYWQYGCDRVVIEANKGGDWIPAVLRLIDPRIPVTLVHATEQKRTRAEPVSALYEQARVHHVGPPRLFDKLEGQMTSWVGDPNEDSPDLMDALVWALWALFIETSVQEAHVAKAADRRLRGRR